VDRAHAENGDDPFDAELYRVIGPQPPRALPQPRPEPLPLPLPLPAASAGR
jgi:hypothetical protein